MSEELLCNTVEKHSIAMQDTERKRMLGLRLVEARRAQRLSQQRAADIMGVGRMELVDWEEGKASPSALQLGNVAMTYGVCAHALLFGSPWMQFDVRKILGPTLTGRFAKR